MLGLLPDDAVSNIYLYLFRGSLFSVKYLFLKVLKNQTISFKNGFRSLVLCVDTCRKHILKRKKKIPVNKSQFCDSVCATAFLEFKSLWNLSYECTANSKYTARQFARSAYLWMDLVWHQYACYFSFLSASLFMFSFHRDILDEKKTNSEVSKKSFHSAFWFVCCKVLTYLQRKYHELQKKTYSETKDICEISFINFTFWFHFHTLWLSVFTYCEKAFRKALKLRGKKKQTGKFIWICIFHA